MNRFMADFFGASLIAAAAGAGTWAPVVGITAAMLIRLI